MIEDLTQQYIGLDRAAAYIGLSGNCALIRKIIVERPEGLVVYRFGQRAMFIKRDAFIAYVEAQMREAKKNPKTAARMRGAKPISELKLAA